MVNYWDNDEKIKSDVIRSFKRAKGRPKTTWLNVIRKDLEVKGIHGDLWMERNHWRRSIHVRCKKNIENRKRQKMNHTGGTKSFTRHKADYAKISDELTNLVETHGEETPELRQQTYVAARGLVTRGRVRGYGRGMMPEMIPWVSQTQPTSSSLRSCTGRAYANLQSQYSGLEEKYDRQQKELNELKQMITPRILHLQQQSSSQQQSNSQQQSPSQQWSPSEQTPISNINQHHRPRSPSQQHSPSEHTPTSYTYHPYQHLPPYPYTSSSQFYYPRPFQPSLYHPMPHPPGEFTAMLNDSDFLQHLMPPNDRNGRDKS